MASPDEKAEFRLVDGSQVGKLLKAIRMSKNLRQVDVGEMLGCEGVNISRRELQGNVRLNELIAHARALGFDIVLRER